MPCGGGAQRSGGPVKAIDKPGHLLQCGEFEISWGEAIVWADLLLHRTFLPRTMSPILLRRRPCTHAKSRSDSCTGLIQEYLRLLSGGRRLMVRCPECCRRCLRSFGGRDLLYPWFR